MVIDSIAYADSYLSLSPNFKTALDWLRRTDVTGWDAGKYEIDGERVYAIIQRYTTAPADECKAESHEKYADIQYVISGKEKLGYDPIESAIPNGENVPEEDVTYYKQVNQYLNMCPGTFAILWPRDVHTPRCEWDAPSEVLKVLVKVMV